MLIENWSELPCEELEITVWSLEVIWLNMEIYILNLQEWVLSPREYSSEEQWSDHEALDI